MPSILRRERLIVYVCLTVMVLACWAYLIYERITMPADMDMPGMVMLDLRAWGARDLALLLVMWIVMMAAMMVPSAAPMLQAFLTVNAGRRESGRPYVSIWFFLLGYLAVWTAYSVATTAAQWGLHKAALLSTMMESTSPLLNGAMLLAAGVFQWTPLKHACLSGCRSPLGFLMSQWRSGRQGAFVMGLRHGAYCLGCCWLLMALLFVTGVMNLFWVVMIALFVLVEKSVARGELFSRTAGVALMIAGVRYFMALT